MTDSNGVAPEPTTIRPLRLDIISDVVCPWCYIHYRRIETVRANWPEGAIAIAWRPFQLDPTVPPEGFDRKAYLEKKFGNSERLGQMSAALQREGAAAGIDFDWSRVQRYPNTLDAHRVMHWAGTQDIKTQHRLAELLFRLYFEEGGDLSDHDALADAAEAAGLQRDIVTQLLASDADADLVREEIARIGEIGVQGVPFTLIEQQYGLSGAQPVETMDDAFRRILAARETSAEV